MTYPCSLACSLLLYDLCWAHHMGTSGHVAVLHCKRVKGNGNDIQSPNKEDGIWFSQWVFLVLGPLITWSYKSGHMQQNGPSLQNPKRNRLEVFLTKQMHTNTLLVNFQLPRISRLVQWVPLAGTVVNVLSFKLISLICFIGGSTVLVSFHNAIERWALQFLSTLHFVFIDLDLRR